MPREIATVEAPGPSVKAPTVSLLAMLLLPRNAKVPPFRVMPALFPKRLAT